MELHVDRPAVHTRAGATWVARSTQIITGGLVLTGMVVLAQTITQWIDFRFFDLRIRILDSGHHASVFGAASLLAQAMAAAAMGLCAVLSRRRRHWLCVAGLVGVLAAVRALMRYEPAFVRYEIPILVAPLAVIVALLLYLTFAETKLIRWAVWGALFLLGCSFALHGIGIQADGNNARLVWRTWAYQATGMVKHGAELAGWMLLATGMAALGCATVNRASPSPRDR
jgi:hypothetical protein